MGRRSLPSFIILWKRHTHLYLEVFSIALRELAKTDSVSGDENAISEKLSVFLNLVCFRLGKSRNQEIQTPYWETPIQPVVEDELKGGKKQKRPDFTCRCVNTFSNSPEEHEISFHVECKRLGHSSNKSWNFNKNYVEKGIKRFDCKIHEYGKRAPSGMMIGYIINMAPQEIETKVNDYQKEKLPNFTDIKFSFNKGRLYQTYQKMKRRNVLPVKFELIHLWIVLRNNYKAYPHLL